METTLIAIETSSTLGSIALLLQREGRVCVHTREHVGEHAERLLPMVDELLEGHRVAPEELDTIVFGQGPGGFTGLRVACGLAQGMAFALGLRVIPIDSLLAVAALDASLRGPDIEHADTIAVVVQDARMGEVYLGAYRSSPTPGDQDRVWRSLQDPVLMNADDVGDWLCRAQSLWVTDEHAYPAVRLVGDALSAYPRLGALGVDARGKAVTDRVTLGGPLRAHAAMLARLGLQAWQRGEAIAPENASPLYVRDKVAFTTRERADGKGGNPKAETPVSIVPMIEADLDDVAHIESTVQSFPWSRGNFAEGLRAGYSAWVARRGDRILGFTMQMYAPDLAHLLLIAVSRDAQKTGIGSRLLAHCEHEARNRGLPAMLLEVRPSNRNAVTFYEKRGYVASSVRKGYYPSVRGAREDAWVMQKQLVPAGGAS